MKYLSEHNTMRLKTYKGKKKKTLQKYKHMEIKQYVTKQAWATETLKEKIKKTNRQMKIK